MNSKSVRFPLSVEKLTPTLLTDALAQLYPEVRVRAMRVVQSSTYGNGVTSTADRVTLELDYAEGCGCNLPSRMLLKTLLIEPHVPLTMYENEVLFYRHIRPGLNIEAPQVYATSFDSEVGQFGIMMEDLTLKAARFQQATQVLDDSQIRNAVDAMADLHAQHWMSPRLSMEWSWLPTAASGGMADVFRQESWERHVADMVATCDIKQRCLKTIDRTVSQLYEDVWRVNDGIFSSEPQTFLHGDLHMANIYLLPNDRVGFIDWQLASKGSWVQDFTYLVVTALDTDSRKRQEKALLAAYLERLQKQAVRAVPTWDEAWHRYRQSVIWGLAIGWLGCPVENYGPQVLAANMQRLSAAVMDLGTFDAIWN